VAQPNSTAVNCRSPQVFSDMQLVDIQVWEATCGIFWTQQCSVIVEHTVVGLQDTTDYFFIITAINMGGPGAINAPYHPSAGFGNGAEHHGEYPRMTGAGFIRAKPAMRVYQGMGAEGVDEDGMIQLLGEGDFSDTSAVAVDHTPITLNARVLAMDRLGLIPLQPGRYVTNAPYFATYPAMPGSEWVGPFNGTGPEPEPEPEPAPAPSGRRRAIDNNAAPTVEEQIARWDDGSHHFGYRSLTPAMRALGPVCL
jgi:hypothetical protein